MERKRLWMLWHSQLSKRLREEVDEVHTLRREGNSKVENNGDGIGISGLLETDTSKTR